MYDKLESFMEGQDLLLIQQVKELVEIFTNIETRNQYQMLDKSGQEVGFIAEESGGIGGTFLRLLLRIRRPMKITVLNGEKREILRIQRPFYLLWSTMTVTCGQQKVGSIQRRFSLLYKLYDLCDRRGKVIARIRAPIWKLWVFPVLNSNDAEIGKVSKNWSGFLKEYFTDADRFSVEFPSSWKSDEKAILLAAAISIDLDYFEENEGSR